VHYLLVGQGWRSGGASVVRATRTNAGDNAARQEAAHEKMAGNAKLRSLLWRTRVRAGGFCWHSGAFAAARENGGALAAGGRRNVYSPSWRFSIPITISSACYGRKVASDGRRLAVSRRAAGWRSTVLGGAREGGLLQALGDACWWRGEHLHKSVAYLAPVLHRSASWNGRELLPHCSARTVRINPRITGGRCAWKNTPARLLVKCIIF